MTCSRDGKIDSNRFASPNRMSSFRFGIIGGYSLSANIETSVTCSLSSILITFCVSSRRREMYNGHSRLCVCLSVCLSLAAFPHYCTDPGGTWGNGRGCPLAVHYWADLQSVHGFRCYDNIAPSEKCQRVLMYSLYAWFRFCFRSFVRIFPVVTIGRIYVVLRCGSKINWIESLAASNLIEYFFSSELPITVMQRCRCLKVSWKCGYDNDGNSCRADRILAKKYRYNRQQTTLWFKNVPPLTYYNFDIYDLIIIIFGRSVTKKVVLHYLAKQEIQKLRIFS